MTTTVTAASSERLQRKPLPRTGRRRHARRLHANGRLCDVALHDARARRAARDRSRRIRSKARRCPSAATSSTPRRNRCSSRDGERTKMTIPLEMEPDFFVPPVLGPWYLKRTLAQGGCARCTRIEHSRATATPRSRPRQRESPRAENDHARAVAARVVRPPRPARPAVAARPARRMPSGSRRSCCSKRRSGP